MKVTCGREQLLESLGLVEKVSGKNLNLPILNCVLLVAEEKQLILRATNLELGMEATLPAQVHLSGVIAVPADVLYSTISASYGGTSIALAVQGNNLEVVSGGSTSRIKTLTHDDFPTIPTIKKPTTLTLGAADVLKGIRSVWYSASLSSIKPELASVYVAPGDKRLVFVATDSFRLAEKVVPHNTIPDFNPLLIPFRNTADIIRVLERGGEKVSVYISDTQIAFVYDDLYLTSRLVDGNFPDYKQIVPKDTTAEAVILKQDLVQAFKKLNVFSDKFNQMTIELKPSKKVFTLRAHNADVGETVEELNAALTGGDLTISFNHKYVTDCFQSITGDSVRFSFAGLSKPVVIRGVSDSTFMYLVMPMNR